MAGVTDTGWYSKTFAEILAEYIEGAEEAWGADFPSTPDSVFGELSNILAAPAKDLWDLGQQIEDSQNRDTATGIYLDYLAELVGLSRLTASGATGLLLFTGSAGTTVTENTACKDTLSRIVLTTEEVDLNRSNCYSATFSINSFTDNTNYTIIVEGVTNTFNSGNGNDVETVLAGLKATLDVNNNSINEIVDETLVLYFPSYNNQLTTTNTANITLESVGVLVSSEATEEGELDFEAGTVTKLVTPNLGIASVTNPEDFQTGRYAETDPELRIRMAEREQSTGTATKPSIEASLSEISGVSSVLIIVNDTLNDSISTGIPAKSFETFVQGGDENDIADVIWRSKPVMGQTHGDIEKTITDDNGDTQSVKFSRLTERFAWLRVTYSINDEENFPTGGETAMKEAVVAYGETMSKGEDLTPTKFYGSLYSVQGIYVSKIEIAITGDSGDTPTYVETTIPVSDTEFLSFSVDQVTITT